MAGALRKTILYMPASVLGPIIQLATIVILTHWLRPAELGVYAMAVALQDLVQIATLSWWSQYVLRYLEDAEPGVRARQDGTELVVLILAGLAQALILAYAVTLPFIGVLDPFLIGAIALAGIMRALVGHWSVRARATERIDLYAIAQVGGPALTLGLSLLGFLLLAPSLTIAFFAMALGHAIVALPMALAVRYRSAPGVDRSTLSTSFRYGVFTSLGTGLAWVSMQSVRFVSDVILGAAAVGLLHVGWGVGQRLATQVGVLATTALFPIAAAKARAEGVTAGVQSMKLAGPALLATLAPAVVATFALADILSRLMVAEEYRQATAAILPLAALAGGIRAFRNHYLDEILQLTEDSRLMAMLDAFEAATTLVLCAIGALTYGIIGAIIGALAATAVTTAAGWRVVARRHGSPLAAREAISTVLAAGVMALAFLWLPSPTGWIDLMGIAAAAGLAYITAYGVLEHRQLLKILRDLSGPV